MQHRPVPNGISVISHTAVNIAFTLHSHGWFLHQHPSIAARFEEDSSEPLELDEASKGLMDIIQRLLDSEVALLPQPKSVPVGPKIPSNLAGHLILPFYQQPVPELTASNSASPEEALKLWGALIPELANDWARVSVPLSYGRIFMGPKERLCYWPRLVNTALPR